MCQCHSGHSKGPLHPVGSCLHLDCCPVHAPLMLAACACFVTGCALLPQPCPFGYTSAVGAASKEQCVLSPQACPIGQWAPDDAVSPEECRCYPGFGGGEKAEDPCTICPAGYFSVGKSLDKCAPCGFGLTSPAGSPSQDDCYPVKSCPAGTRECTRGGVATSWWCGVQTAIEARSSTLLICLFLHM